MRNIELYRTIEELLQSKKEQYTPAKSSFAHEYCQKQIKRKKLVPFNPQSKMERIMKNFNQLDTYVDVAQVLKHIDYKKMEKQKSEHRLGNLPSMKWKTNQLISFGDFQSLEYIRSKLGPYNERIYHKENEELRSLIKFLEDETHVGSFKRRNSPENDDFNFYTRNTEVQDERLKSNKFKEKWNYYEGCSYRIIPSSEKKILTKENKMEFKENLKFRRQRMYLIHQVTTYLQIILESHHKRKWEKKNSNKAYVDSTKQDTTSPLEKSQNTSVAFVVPSRTATPMRASKKMSRFIRHRPFGRNTGHIQPRSHFDKSEQFQKSQIQEIIANKQQSGHNSSLSSPSLQANPIQNINSSLRQTFTFRNRNIKQNVLKKVTQFLQFLQAQEKQFKKQKNISIKKLNHMLEKKEKIRNQIGGDCFIVDQEILKDVRNIVHMQK